MLKGDRVVVTESIRAQVLEAAHAGHQGETKCLLLNRQSVLWPGISGGIRQMAKDCELCNKYQQEQPKLPAMQPDLPTIPWEKLGSDILRFNGANYVFIVDYYSRFPIIRPLANKFQSLNQFIIWVRLTLSTNCRFWEPICQRHVKKKSQESGITLTFSSPYHHQTNGVAERCVGTTKSLWKKAADAWE